MRLRQSARKQVDTWIPLSEATTITTNSLSVQKRTWCTADFSAHGSLWVMNGVCVVSTYTTSSTLAYACTVKRRLVRIGALAYR